MFYVFMLKESKTKGVIYHFKSKKTKIIMILQIFGLLAAKIIQNY